MTAPAESNRGLFVAWCFAALLAAISVLLPWLSIHVVGYPGGTRSGLGDLEWRGVVYPVATPTLLLLTLVAILTRGVVRYIVATLAAGAAVVVLADIASILQRRHRLTLRTGTYDGLPAAQGAPPAGGRKLVGAAIADIHDGGLPLGLVAVLLLLFVVILTVSDRYRPVAGLVYGTLLMVCAFAFPYQGAWLNDSATQYTSYGLLTDPVRGPTFVLVMLLLLCLAASALRWRHILLRAATWSVGVLAFLLVQSVLDAGSTAAQNEPGRAAAVDEFAPGFGVLAAAVLIGAAMSG